MAEQVSYIASSSVMDKGEGDDSDGGSEHPQNKSVHSVVEKKRRDKMTQYVTDLSNMIPMCGAMQRKLDKITVLRMAVQHMKALKVSEISVGKDKDGAALLEDENIMKAIIESANCFLYVVSCDRGKFLYVSESVSNFIQCQHSELIGQSIFDLVHPKDVAKIKEQLIASDLTAREIFIDAKTMEPVDPAVLPKNEINVSSSGAARSFFCRIKSFQPSGPTDGDLFSDARKKKSGNLYINIHCSGFLKTWASSKVATASNQPDSLDVSSNLACLVAVARAPPQLKLSELEKYSNVNMTPVHFYAKLNYEYKFCVVDPLVTYVTGFLPQEIMGSSVFELIHDSDINQFKELLKMSTKTSEKIVSPIMNMKSNQPGLFLPCRIVMSIFKNPFNMEIEHTSLDITVVIPGNASTHMPTATNVCSQAYSQGPMPDQSLPSPQSQVSNGCSDNNFGSNASTEWGDDAHAEVSRTIIMSYLEADGGLGEESNLNNFDNVLFS